VLVWSASSTAAALHLQHHTSNSNSIRTSGQGQVMQPYLHVSANARCAVLGERIWAWAVLQVKHHDGP
jgi:hypothetical protein